MSSPWDMVIELANEGVDRVYSDVSHALAPNTEVLILTGRQAVIATGNGLDNAIAAGSGPVDGDATADFVIVLTGSLTLTASDFIL